MTNKITIEVTPEQLAELKIWAGERAEDFQMLEQALTVPTRMADRNAVSVPTPTEPLGDLVHSKVGHCHSCGVDDSSNFRWHGFDGSRPRAHSVQRLRP